MLIERGVICRAPPVSFFCNVVTLKNAGHPREKCTHLGPTLLKNVVWKIYIFSNLLNLMQQFTFLSFSSLSKFTNRQSLEPFMPDLCSGSFILNLLFSVWQTGCCLTVIPCVYSKQTPCKYCSSNSRPKRKVQAVLWNESTTVQVRWVTH